ncbi:DMT family transporter [Pseudomaricurvus alkylphenolicus]|uniref:DMT family transporter n=1 Tax=Pseudomaricurvus alkylphenolicus TaxID=1306991 RepID=UPI001422D9AB|nr:DMT family transporter [Pseudomaricurvus alkylphenolicus]NIB42580.1 DMT family transporter [Pseudomaricurvus alkylphenolicus]
MTISNSKTSGYLFASTAVLIWTGFILVSRHGGLSGLNHFDVIAIRYLTCAAVLLPLWWFWFRFQLLDLRLLVASLVGGLAYAVTTFKGFELAPASHAALLLPGLMPVTIALISAASGDDRPSPNMWFGMGVITFGIALLLALQLWSAGGIAAGDPWLMGGALCWSLFSVLVRRWKITPWQATVSLAVYTAALYLPVYLLCLPKTVSPQLWQEVALQAVYQGVLATIVQMFCYVKAVQLLGPARVGTWMALVPVLSGIAALVIFNEPANSILLLGFVLVSGGAWYASRSQVVVTDHTEKGEHHALRQYQDHQ